MTAEQKKYPYTVTCPTCFARPEEPCLTGRDRIAPRPHGQRVKLQDRFGGTGTTVRTAMRPSMKRTPREVPTATRRQLRARSRGRCEAVDLAHDCTHQATHAHHILRRSQGGKHYLENLLHVCLNGHDAIHDRIAEAVALGYLDRSAA